MRKSLSSPKQISPSTKSTATRLSRSKLASMSCWVSIVHMLPKPLQFHLMYSVLLCLLPTEEIKPRSLLVWDKTNSSMLLGHGTGKLLQETAPGVYNFDPKNPPISPVTNKPITTYYKPGQTWGSVFGSIASSYEECRAETVAMALSCDFEILKIFGFGDGTADMDGEAGDVLYAAYLSMARAGIASLELWDPKSRKWGQAHSQARFSILKCFLQSPDQFCKLDYKNDDLSDLTIKIDRNKITTAGRKAVESYLQKLHIYKSTANVETGTKFYNEMTEVEPVFWGEKIRNEVLRNKQPRKVFVQANTVLDETTGKVSLVEYDPSLEGMIKSYAERGI